MFAEEKAGKLNLQKDHSYYHQIQGQLYITQMHCTNLSVWTSADVEIIQIVKDPDLEIDLEKLEQFYFDLFLDTL